MSPGANKRQTGTVPKAKASRKNSVPQEIVAPTRRDLQQHLNVSIINFNHTISQSQSPFFAEVNPRQVTTLKNSLRILIPRPTNGDFCISIRSANFD